VVLFHKAARVQSLDIPNSTAIDAQLYEYDDDGIEIHPWVWEQIPSNPTAPGQVPIRLEPEDLLVSEALESSTPEDYNDERRDPVLKLDISNLQVHVVKSVEFETDSHPVHRHRSEKKQPPG
jgi:hypothetical protein